MSLFSKLLLAVQSWRRQRGGPKATKRVRVTMEQLDHRQLLSVNFTGNVATDFPASLKPGVVVIPNNPNVTHPVIDNTQAGPDGKTLRDLVKVSGFDINGMRVSYDAVDDVLSIGLEQPLSQQPDHPGPVIAGDADNNGNSGTVNPAVEALKPGFKDFADMGGSEHMGVFLDLKGTGFADVVAGYAIDDPRSPKQFQVAQAVVNTNAPPTTAPDFGTMLPDNTGNVYLVNSPAHPNLEFAIDHFAKLYLAETGKALSPTTKVGIGAFGGSDDDIGIGEAFFPEAPFTVGQATTTPVTCPPCSPPILINPHENGHIDTAHPSDIRVNIFGSSGFDATQIDPKTVTLGGAHPISEFTRKIAPFPFPEETFVFKGTDVHLPPGLTTATVTGQTFSGQAFTSTVKVFNKDLSFYTPAEIQQRLRREQLKKRHTVTVSDSLALPTGPTTPTTRPASSSQVVSIARRRPVVAGQGHGTQVSSRLQSSMSSFLQQSSTAPVVASGMGGGGAS